MKTFIKRALSALLVAVMLISATPSGGFADLFDFSIEASAADSNAGKATTSNSYFSKIWVSSITKTDARIHGDLARATTVKESGFYIGTSESNMKKNPKKDGYFTGCENIAYTMSQYYGTLNSGTKYYYKLYYITTSGVERCSSVDSFTTEAGNVAGDFSQKTNSYFSKVTTVSLGKTDARIRGDLATATTVKEAGFYIGTSESNLKKNSKKDGYFKNCEYIAYTMSEYYGQLKPGTKYFYKLYYITTNGTERCSPVNYFVTKGTSSDFVLTVYFNANGGKTDSSQYTVKNDMVCYRDTSNNFTQDWIYDNTKKNGLSNGTDTMGLYKSGYTFVGWGTSASGGTIFDENDTSLKPSKINPNLVYGNCTTTLYAQWKKTNDIYNLGEETYKFANFKKPCKGYHCFGMSITSAAYYLGLLEGSYVGITATKDLYSLTLSEELRKPICFYQVRQGKEADDAIVAGGRWYFDKPNNIQEDWKEAINYVKNHKYDGTGLLQISFRYVSGEGENKKEYGHAVNFLRYEVVNGQERIYIYDNESPTEESYIYKASNGKIAIVGKTSYSELTCIALRDVKKYFSLAEKFKFSQAIYAKKDTINVVGAKQSVMDTGDSDVEEVMFEIPDTMTEVEIIPLVENAEFEYLDESYAFGNNIKDAVGVLKLASLNDEGIEEEESDFIIKTIPKKVNSVNVDETLNLTYKSSGTLIPRISADSGARYTVAYVSSNPSVASVDANGKISTGKTGSATITVTVTDEYGNVVTDSCEVNVSYSWWQWIIVIVLFGWIWY